MEDWILLRSEREKKEKNKRSLKHKQPVNSEIWKTAFIMYSMKWMREIWRDIPKKYSIYDFKKIMTLSELLMYSFFCRSHFNFNFHLKSLNNVSLSHSLRLKWYVDFNRSICSREEDLQVIRFGVNGLICLKFFEKLKGYESIKIFN
jgi:hypothetical protein